MQIQSPSPPQLPTPPGTPAVPGVVAQQVIVAPVTRREIDALLMRRSELSTQLSSAQSRRDALSRQLERVPVGVARTGVEQHIALLDKRILQLESDLDAVGQRLSSAAVGLSQTTEPPRFMGPRLSSGQVTGLGLAFTVFVLAPLAMAVLQRALRRSRAPAIASAAPDTANRLERIEQAVDAIALEMERVSEGQRFLTRVLGESVPALGAGMREPIRVPTETR
jgi:hypothetical protein